MTVNPLAEALTGLAAGVFLGALFMGGLPGAIIGGLLGVGLGLFWKKESDSER
jgi:hypothetical protein